MSLDVAPRAAPVGAAAALAALAFAIAVAVLFALDRVGAPSRLVAALGPFLALAGVAAVGVATRARNLTDFLVARRAMPPFFAGLALAANFGGFALALLGAEPGLTGLPWRGALFGAAAAALIVAPHWRARQASSVADVLATRFPSPFTRAAFALVQAGCGWALAAAGLGFAGLTIRDAFGVGAPAAIALCAVALVVTLAPAGLRGLIWADAASAAAGLITVMLFLALSSREGLDASARVADVGETLKALPGAPLVQEVAAAVAAASLFAFATPAFAVASPGAARRAGLIGVVAVALGGMAAVAIGDLTMHSAGDSALAALVACLPAMALARAGVFASARAIGLDLAHAPARLSVLASARMARGRAGVVLGAAVAAWLAARAGAHPDAPLYLALAMWLALAAPSLALAAIPGRASAPAIAALIASLAGAVVARRAGFSNFAGGPDLLVGGFGAGLVGFAAGLAVRAFDPFEPAPPRFADPFVDVPLDL